MPGPPIYHADATVQVPERGYVGPLDREPEVLARVMGTSMKEIDPPLRAPLRGTRTTGAA